MFQIERLCSVECGVRTTWTANLEGNRRSVYRNGLPMQSHGKMQRVALAPFTTIRMAGINRAQTRSRVGLRLSQSLRPNRGLLFGAEGGGMDRPVVLRIVRKSWLVHKFIHCRNLIVNSYLHVK
jgi:hypothetical protein